MGLADEAEDFGVSPLAVDDNLRCRPVRLVAVIGGMDALLQFEHYRAGGVDDFDAVAAGGFIGLRRFAVCPEQHFHVVQLLQLLVGNGLQTTAGETVHLGSIVHNVTQAVQVPGSPKFLLCFADGCRYPKAEA